MSTQPIGFEVERRKGADAPARLTALIVFAANLIAFVSLLRG